MGSKFKNLLQELLLGYYGIKCNCHRIRGYKQNIQLLLKLYKTMKCKTTRNTYGLAFHRNAAFLKLT
jgi:hypothetical protein